MKNVKKLRLSKETLRTLSSNELMNVNAAGYFDKVAAGTDACVSARCLDTMQQCSGPK